MTDPNWQDLERRSGQLQLEVMTLAAVTIAAMIPPEKPGERQRVRRAVDRVSRTVNGLLEEEQYMPAETAVSVRKVKKDLDRLDAMLEGWELRQERRAHG